MARLYNLGLGHLKAARHIAKTHNVDASSWYEMKRSGTPVSVSSRTSSWQQQAAQLLQLMFGSMGRLVRGSGSCCQCTADDRGRRGELPSGSARRQVLQHVLGRIHAPVGLADQCLGFGKFDGPGLLRNSNIENQRAYGCHYQKLQPVFRCAES